MNASNKCKMKHHEKVKEEDEEEKNSRKLLDP